MRYPDGGGLIAACRGQVRLAAAGLIEAGGQRLGSSDRFPGDPDVGEPVAAALAAGGRQALRRCHAPQLNAPDQETSLLVACAWPAWLMLPAVAARMVAGETRPENEKVADPVHGDNTDDAARWWRAYQLAENDQADELRGLAAAGDDHARRQLASWLSDRAFSGELADRAGLEEAIEVIRPLADAGDDVAELWLARWLADCDRLDELRQRAGHGDDYARYWLDEALSQS